MAIPLSDSIRTGQQKSVEDKYLNNLVPYTNIAQAKTLIPIGQRFAGLTINIAGIEYWWEPNTTDLSVDPVVKEQGGGGVPPGGTTGQMIQKTSNVDGETEWVDVSDKIQDALNLKADIPDGLQNEIEISERDVDDNVNITAKTGDTIYYKFGDTFYNLDADPPISLPVPDASTDNKRVDIIYLEEDGFHIQEGIEDLEAFTEPSIPAGAIRVAPVYVTGNSVEPPAPDLSGYVMLNPAAQQSGSINIDGTGKFKNVDVDGGGGAGFIHLAPNFYMTIPIPVSGINFFAGTGLGTFGWRQNNGYFVRLTSNSATHDIVYSLPDVPGSSAALATLNGGQIFTAAEWKATVIAALYGGTGQTAVTLGDLLFGSGTNAWSRLGIGSTDQILKVIGGVPAWANAPSTPSLEDVRAVDNQIDGDIDANGHQINNLMNAASAQQAVTLNQLDAQNTALLAAIDTAGSITKRWAGDYDASTGFYPTLGTGPGGAIRRGDEYRITVGGTISGRVLEIGDVLSALIANPGTSNSNWYIGQGNVDQATESVRGTVKIATQSNIEDENSTLDTDAVTPKKFWQGLARFRALAWTFLAKITFSVAPRFSSVTASHYLKTDASKDLTSSATIPVGDISGTLPVGNGGTGLSTIGTANQVLSVNTTGTAAEYKTLTGTTNQVIVTQGVGATTFSLPQSINTTGTPQFTRLGLGTTINNNTNLNLTGATSGGVPMIINGGIATTNTISGAVWHETTGNLLRFNKGSSTPVNFIFGDAGPGTGAISFGNSSGYYTHDNTNLSWDNSLKQLKASQLFIPNTTAPATPTGGGVLYVESGSLKFKGSSGTVTVIAVP